jgi:hypothetical protein
MAAHGGRFRVIAELGAVAFNAGILLLSVSVIRERWFTSKTDKYKGVIR